LAAWLSAEDDLMGKRSRRRRREASAAQPPGNFVTSLVTMAKLMEELHAGADLGSMIASRRTELRSVIERFDAVHLLAHVQLGETIRNPETYSESENAGSAFIVEMLAAELLVRPNRAGSLDHTPAIDGNVLEPIRRLTREAAFLESVRRYRDYGAFDSPEGMARSRAAAGHLMLRGPSWPWQERETLRGLFGPERFASALTAKLGFNADEGIELCEAAHRLLNERIHGDRDALFRAAAEFGPDSPSYQWAEQAFDPAWKDAGPAEVRAHAITALWWLNHVGDSMLIDPSMLANAAGTAEPAAKAFLAALGCQLGEADRDWFSLAEHVRFHPYVECDPGRYYLTVPGNDLWALRGIFEEAVKGDRYSRHRSAWLEHRTRDLLSAALHADEAHVDVRFPYDENGEQRHSDIDALVRCGDAAVIVEAKSATLRAGARRGGDALIGHLRDNIAKASDQATRAKNALAEGVALQVDGEEMRLGEEIREVHPIVVTLDDLSSVATVLWQLEGTRAMPAGITAPWLVTLYELELVCETVEHPASLIHFLRRRSRVNELGRFFAHDELDWWMHYLQYGLYFEHDKDDGPVRFASLTDPLDAWVLHAHGERKTPAPKPKLALDGQTEQVLRLLAEERGDGWLPASCLLLDVNGKARREFWKGMQRLRKRARQRDRVQRGVFGFDGGPNPMMIAMIVAPDEHGPRLLDALEDYIAGQLATQGEQAVLGLAVTACSQRPFDAFVVVELAWWASSTEQSDDG
jgi:hypothetical protein